MSCLLSLEPDTRFAFAILSSDISIRVFDPPVAKHFFVKASIRLALAILSSDISIWAFDCPLVKPVNKFCLLSFIILGRLALLKCSVESITQLALAILSLRISTVLTDLRLLELIIEILYGERSLRFSRWGCAFSGTFAPLAGICADLVDSGLFCPLCGVYAGVLSKLPWGNGLRLLLGMLSRQGVPVA